MAKKRLVRKQKGYEAYRSVASRIAIVASVLGMGFLAASVVNEAFNLRDAAITESKAESPNLFPYVYETVVPRLSHTLFLLFALLGILLCSLYFLREREEYRKYACASFITSSLLGLVSPAYDMVGIAEALKDTIPKIKSPAPGEEPPFASVREYLVQTFAPSYLEQIAIVLVLLGVLLLAIHYLTRGGMWRTFGFAKVLVGGILGTMGETLTVYYMLLRLQKILPFITQLIETQQGGQYGITSTSIEQYVGEFVIPIILKFAVLGLFFLGVALLAYYFLWGDWWARAVGGYVIIGAGVLGVFRVFLDTSFSSLAMGGELGKVEMAFQGGQSYPVTLGEVGLQVSSMLGYLTRKFIPYYLDQFSMALLYVSAIVFAFYLTRRS